ncbi:chemotaxis regulator CheZ [Hartmannibacter diazotrophicus]|uniref:Chemotaxis regulator CheZ n=1 Tax=Hartmannibacter diazotrophicus TaxID=1482074 RepID=A0A2C9D7F7_9HYPH|nr:chemotaxis protein [Hartmannibacter diazotrophicus]SON56264.1 chemotaxis regulator CheZ [Hartmannibacter diazotrophicus]
MTQSQVPSPLREQDYEAIENAVMETERGRWFLAEYTRRHRAADTVMVMDAVQRLEKLLHRERRPDIDRIRLDIGEMKDAIERTKAEIAEIKFEGPDGSRFNQASDELDAIVSQTENATSEILEAAEKIQEIAWTMREAKIEPEICDAIELLTTTIYTSCSFQDLTGQRTHKVVHVLRYLESRIDAMIQIWGLDDSEARAAGGSAKPANPMDTRPDAHLLNGPQLEGQGVAQTDVDDLMAFDAASMADEISFDAIASDDDAGDEPADHGFGADDAAAMADEISFDAIGSDDEAGDELSGQDFGADDAAAMADEISFDAIGSDDETEDELSGQDFGADDAAAMADEISFDAIGSDDETGDELPDQDMGEDDAAAMVDETGFDAIAASDDGEDGANPDIAEDDGSVDPEGHLDEAIFAMEDEVQPDDTDEDLAAFIADGRSDVKSPSDATEKGAEDALKALSPKERMALFA